MKKILICLTVTISFSIIQGAENLMAQSKKSPNSTARTTQSDTIEMQLQIEGMSCQKGCADGIDAKLKKTKGVIRSKTIFETGISNIRFDKRLTSRQAILDTIRELGYIPTEIPSRSSEKAN